MHALTPLGFITACHDTQDDATLTLEDGTTPRRSVDTDSDVEEVDVTSADDPVPFSALLRDTSVSEGKSAISERQRRVFGGRLASVVSTDVQIVPGGDVHAVVLGTLTSAPRASAGRPGRGHRGRRVTFLHTFILEKRATGSSGAGSDDGDIDDPNAPRLDYIIASEVLRRLDGTETGGDAAVSSAATVLQAALSPQATPPRPARGLGGGERGNGDATGGGRVESTPMKPRVSPLPGIELRTEWSIQGSPVPAATPLRGRRSDASSGPSGGRGRRAGDGHGGESSDVDEQWLDDAPSATPSPAPIIGGGRPPRSPFPNDGGVSAVARTPVGTPGVELGTPSGAGGHPPNLSPDLRARLSSPSATLLPLPSPMLLQRGHGQRPSTSPGMLEPGSGGTRLQRVERRYSHEHEDAGTRRNLAFDASPFADRARQGRSEVEGGEREPGEVEDGKGTGDGGGIGRRPPPSARYRRRVFSSATSSPAMSAVGASHHASPLQGKRHLGGGGEDCDLVESTSPAAKRGLSHTFYDNALWEGGDGGSGRSPRHPHMGGASVHTISERSDEGSKAGSASASVSVSEREEGEHIGDLGGSIGGVGSGWRGWGGGGPVGQSGLDGYSAYEESDDGGGSVLRHAVADGETDEWSHRWDRRWDHQRRRSLSPARQSRGPSRGTSQSPSGRSSRGGISPLHGGGRRHRRTHHRGSVEGGETPAYGYGTPQPPVRYRDRYGRPINERHIRMGMGISRGGSYSASVSAAASPTASRPGSRSAAGIAAASTWEQRRVGRMSSGAGSIGRSSRPGATSSEHVKLRRAVGSAPPTPSAGATRAREFGNHRSGMRAGYRAHAGARSSVRHGGRGDTYPSDMSAQPLRRRSAGVRAQDRDARLGRRPASPVARRGELKLVVTTLSALAASVHFTAAAVVFAVLLMAIHANRRSTDALSVQLDRMDAVVAAGRVPHARGSAAGKGGGFSRPLTHDVDGAGASVGSPSPGIPPLVSSLEMKDGDYYGRKRFSGPSAVDDELGEGGPVDVRGFLRPPGDVKDATRVVVYASSGQTGAPEMVDPNGGDF